ncbi:MAG: hypothetical protein ACRDGD_13125 [Candidatus Limnocylindria bacterium]
MSERRRLIARLMPVGLLGILALALVAPSTSWADLAAADRTRAGELVERLDALPDAPTVVVGFDPDLGTYAEIRPTVRVLIAELLARDARLAIVSLTPEGRVLALAELDRLGRAEANHARMLDLGFIAGAEAALVELSRRIESGDPGSIARTLEAEGLAGADAALVIGGNDLGPRSWVEQVLPRVPGLSIIAVAPTVLLPELVPYLASGQLDALLGTPADGAAYRALADVGSLERLAADRAPASLAVLVGLAIAIIVLGQALAGPVLGSVRTARRGDAG